MELVIRSFKLNCIRKHCTDAVALCNVWSTHCNSMHMQAPFQSCGSMSGLSQFFLSHARILMQFRILNLGREYSVQSGSSEQASNNPTNLSTTEMQMQYHESWFRHVARAQNKTSPLIWASPPFILRILVSPPLTVPISTPQFCFAHFCSPSAFAVNRKIDVA